MINTPAEAPGFDRVWAMFQELREEMREERRETARQMKETDRKIGELGNRFGELAEHLVLPGIMKKFNALGMTFSRTSQHLDIHDDEDPCTGAEIDILLENGEIAIAVEVKSKTAFKDVDRHRERMAVLRRWADRHHDTRKLLGAMAGAITTKEVRDYALKAGFYVIVQSGDTVAIDVPPHFRPREW